MYFFLYFTESQDHYWEKTPFSIYRQLYLPHNEATNCTSQYMQTPKLKIFMTQNLHTSKFAHLKIGYNISGMALYST